MTGRRKFSELEAKMSPAQRARVERLAAKLEKKVDAGAESAEAHAGTDRLAASQTLTARSGAAG
jgi:hypothetical protein